MTENSRAVHCPMYIITNLHIITHASVNYIRVVHCRMYVITYMYVHIIILASVNN